MRVGMESPVTRGARTLFKHRVCGPHLPPTRDWGAWKMVRKVLDLCTIVEMADRRGAHAAARLWVQYNDSGLDWVPVNGRAAGIWDCGAFKAGEAAGPRRAGDVAGRLSYSVIITCR